MGNDYGSKVSSEPQRLLHNPSEPPYATLILLSSLPLPEYFHYYKDGSSDYSHVKKLYNHKRVVSIKILDGFEYFELEPIKDYKNPKDLFSWSVELEIHLSQENFAKFLQKPTMQLTYYNYFGIYEAEYTVKELHKITVSFEDAKPVVEYKKKDGKDSIYSEMAVTLVGAFLSDLIGLELKEMSEKEQKDLLLTIEQYKYTVHLNAKHKEFIQQYYSEERIFERIFKVILEGKGGEEYMKWVILHFTRCQNHWKENENRKYLVKPETFAKLMGLLDSQDNPSANLIKALELVLFIEYHYFHPKILENSIFFDFMIKYLQNSPLVWSNGFFQAETPLRDRMHEILKNEKKGDFASFFFQKLTNFPYLKRLFSLTISFGDILGPYFQVHLDRFPKEFVELKVFQSEVLKALPSDEVEIEACQAVSFIHNFLFTPRFEAFSLISEFYNENLKKVTPSQEWFLKKNVITISSLPNAEAFYPLYLFRSADRRWPHLVEVSLFLAQTPPKPADISPLLSVPPEELAQGKFPLSNELEYVSTFKQERAFQFFSIKKLSKPPKFIIGAWSHLDVQCTIGFGVMGFRRQEDYVKFGNRAEIHEFPKWRCFNGIWDSLTKVDEYIRMRIMEEK